MKVLMMTVIIILWLILVNGYETLRNKEKELLQTEILLLKEKLNCNASEDRQ